MKAILGESSDEMGDNLAPLDLGASRKVLQLACGYNHICFLLDNHQVGALDSGTFRNPQPRVPEPLKYPTNCLATNFLSDSTIFPTPNKSGSSFPTKHADFFGILGREWPRQTKPKKGQFMNFSQGHSGTEVRNVIRACCPKDVRNS